MIFCIYRRGRLRFKQQITLHVQAHAELWTVQPCTSTSWVAASASRSRACMHPNIMWMGTGVDDAVHYNVQGSLL